MYLWRVEHSEPIIAICFIDDRGYSHLQQYFKAIRPVHHARKIRTELVVRE